MQLTSPNFQNGQSIPEICTCKGANVSPALMFHDVPKEAQSLALIVSDPDAPNGAFCHWLVWNIPASMPGIPENTAPPATVQGLNDFGEAKYGGPCPPSGTHRYVFTLYALSKNLDLPKESKVNDLRAQLQTCTITTAQLFGTFSA